jgi:hypothetical protein
MELMVSKNSLSPWLIQWLKVVLEGGLPVEGLRLEKIHGPGRLQGASFNHETWEMLLSSLLHPKCNILRFESPLEEVDLEGVLLWLEDDRCKLEALDLTTAWPTKTKRDRLFAAIALREIVHVGLVLEEEDAIEMFARSLPTWTHLQSLSALTDRRILGALAGSSLAKLDLAKCGREISTEDFAALITFLPQLPFLKWFSMTHCDLGELALGNLIRLLPRLSLTGLDLSGNKSLGSGFVELFKETLPSTQLRYLGLAACEFNEDSTCSLFRDVFSHAICPVETVDLSWSFFSARALEEFVLCTQRETCRLAEVSLNYTGVSKEVDGPPLFSMLGHPNYKLKTLQIEHEYGDLQAFMDFGTTCRAGLFRNLIMLLSPREVRRLSRTSALRKLPKDMIRMVREMVFLPAAAFWNLYPQIDSDGNDEDEDESEDEDN